MNKQTEDLYLSFHQELLQFLLKKRDASYSESVAWLKGAAESFFSFMSLTLKVSSQPDDLREQHEPDKDIDKYYIIITIEENSK
ncbi:hypothetical protein ABWK31_10795, partial [Bacillus sp. JJ353]